MSETIAAVGLGSNLGDPMRQIAVAMAAIADHPNCQLSGKSSIYRSAPLGGMDQPDYFNAVVSLQTPMTAQHLLLELQGIEATMGRERHAGRWAARIIDLDLLVFGQEQISEPGLEVPHPGIAARNFVLLPLREICPDLQIPGLGRVADVPVDHLSSRIERLARSFHEGGAESRKPL